MLFNEFCRKLVETRLQITYWFVKSDLFANKLNTWRIRSACAKAHLIKKNDYKGYGEMYKLKSSQIIASGEKTTEKRYKSILIRWTLTEKKCENHMDNILLKKKKEKK